MKPRVVGSCRGGTLIRFLLILNYNYNIQVFILLINASFLIYIYVIDVGDDDRMC